MNLSAAGSDAGRAFSGRPSCDNGCQNKADGDPLGRMDPIHTFKLMMKSAKPAGESFVVTSIQAADALHALHAAIPAFPPLDQPDDIEIRITIVRPDTPVE